jgi:hypothetical protein
MGKKKEREMDATERVARKLICLEYKTEQKIDNALVMYWNFVTRGRILYVSLLHSLYYVLVYIFGQEHLTLSYAERLGSLGFMYFILIYLFLILAVFGTIFMFLRALIYLDETKKKMKLEKEC